MHTHGNAQVSYTLSAPGIWNPNVRFPTGNLFPMSCISDLSQCALPGLKEGERHSLLGKPTGCHCVLHAVSQPDSRQPDTKACVNREARGTGTQREGDWEEMATDT